jgi:hypothetical protein
MASCRFASAREPYILRKTLAMIRSLPNLTFQCDAPTAAPDIFGKISLIFNSIGLDFTSVDFP